MSEEKQTIKKFYTIWDLLDAAPVQREHLVKPLIIDEPKTIMIAGAPAASKTFLGMDISLAVLFSDLFMDWFEILENKDERKVLILDQENSPNDYKVRFQALRKGNNYKMQDYDGMLNVVFINGVNFKDKFIFWLFRYIEKYKPKIIILDSFRKFLDGDENSSDVVNDFFKRINFMKDTYGVTFIILHHLRKEPSGKGELTLNEMRGSSDIGGQVQNAFILEKHIDKVEFEEKFILSQVKNRDGLMVKDIAYSIETEVDEKENLISAKLKFDFFYHKDLIVRDFLIQLVQWFNTEGLLQFRFEEGFEYICFKNDIKFKDRALFQGQFIEALYVLYLKRLLKRNKCTIK